MFNVGDSVTIRKTADKLITNICFADEMKKYIGGTYTIREYLPYHDGYKLEGVVSEVDPDINGDGYWLWAELWLEPEEDTLDIGEQDIMNILE